MIVVLLVLFGGGAAYGAAWLYRRLWARHDPRGRTPTGFGALLAPAMLAAALIGGASTEAVWSLAAACVGALIYWLDDARELSARLRVGLATVTGLVIGAIWFVPADPPLLGLLALLALAGFVHLALVNTINMQDGADLNLAAFVLLTGVLLLAYGADAKDWSTMALACLAFAVPFALQNRHPRTIYFGDSGCFAFAALFTILGAAFVTGRAPPPEAAIPAALPLVDMAFVTAHRIRIRQKFTVRHYFHLYQRLQSCQPGFSYLLPQVAAAAVALALAEGLKAAGVDRTLAVAVGMAVGGLATFLGAHRFFVSGEPGPPPRADGA